MASNCYCCGDDLSSGEKKKRRRPLSSADMQRTLQTLITLTSEQQRTIDVSKLHTGYVCRSCAGLLERYASLYQQIKDNIKAALPVLPTQEAGFETTLAPPPRVRHDAVAAVAAVATAASNESPPVIVSFTALVSDNQIIRSQ
jgi:hypothetical protein